ncbi:MAG TPA: J domain-containing protein [Polyangia bacterium]|nr:J domain-containing protein [Polyangia bacterium]
MERNYYRVLAVASTATTDEIEQSFRQLARRLHPDLNGGDGAAEERMKELNVARTTLTDAGARAAYDERLRREQLARATLPAPGPAAASPALRATGPRPTAAPPAPRPTAATPPFELRPWAAVGRVFWLGLLSLLGLAVVVGLIWLQEGLGQ